MSPEPEPGESGGRFRSRLATELMAYFRDSRSERAFTELYRLTSAEVTQWIRGYLACHGAGLDAGEMLQDTFVNVYMYAGRFRIQHQDSFRVWVRRISTNAVRRARSKQPRASLQALPDELQEPSDLRYAPALVASRAEESHLLRAAYTLFLLHYSRAFLGLKERDRRALQLVEVDELSYSDAGTALAVGPSNMKMIMFRARKRLLVRLGESLRGR